MNVSTWGFNMSGMDEDDVVGYVVPVETNFDEDNYCVAMESGEGINVGPDFDVVSVLDEHSVSGAGERTGGVRVDVRKKGIMFVE